jgi:uncharacterized protein YeaO (DUF488 family)
MGKHVMYRRIYDDASPEDGLRILVDRIWPRGVRKEDARLDEWIRDVAPSTELRRWYGHDPERYDEFRRRYLAELREPAQEKAVRRLRKYAGQDRMSCSQPQRTSSTARPPSMPTGSIVPKVSGAKAPTGSRAVQSSVQVHGSADQSQVSEGLREVP